MKLNPFANATTESSESYESKDMNQDPWIWMKFIRMNSSSGSKAT